MARAPAALAPRTMLTAAISLSAWMKVPHSALRMCSAMYSVSSF